MSRTFRSRARAHLTPLALASMLVLAATPAQAQSVNWVGPNASFWDLTANWSTGVLPGASNTLDLGAFNTELRNSSSFSVLSLTGTGQLSLTSASLSLAAASSIGSLVLSSGTLGGAGDLVVAGTATIGSASLRGAGTLSIGGSATFGNFTSLSLDDGRTLRFNAGATLNNNSINLNPTSSGIAAAGQLLNAAGSTLTDGGTSGVSIFTQNFGAGDDGSSARFTNQGTYNKTGTGSTNITANFVNSGTVTAGAGVLTLGSGSSHTGATLNGAGTLVFGSGTHTLDATTTLSTANVTFSGGTTTIAGTYNVSGTSTFSGGVVALPASITSLGQNLVVSAGTADLGANNVTVSNFTLSGGTLTGSGVLTVAGGGSANLNGGVMRGSGQTVLNAPAVFGNFTSLGVDDGRTLRFNAGATLNNNSINLNPTNSGIAAAGQLLNATGSTLTDGGTSGVSIFTQNFGAGDDGATASFTNQGSYNKTGTGTTTFGVAFTNNGSLTVGAGRLNLSDASTLGGTVAVGPDATLNLSGGNHLVVDAANLSNSGALQLSGGTLQLGGNLASNGLLAISGGTFSGGAGNHSTATYSQSSGVLTGSGNFTVSGASTLTGGQMRGSGTTVLAGLATFGNFSSLGLDDGRTLRIAGGATLNNNSINLNATSGGGAAAGLLVNAAGSTLTDSGASGINIFTQNFGGSDDGSSASFSNQGSYNKTGNGTSSIAVAFTNSGALSVGAGTLQLTNTSTLGGTVAVSAGATLSFNGGDHNVANAANLSNSGTLQVFGGNLLLGGNLASNGLVALSGGTLTAGAGNHSTATYSQSSGVLTGSGNFTVSGASSLTGGQMRDSGTTVLAGPVTFGNFSQVGLDDGRTLRFAGGATLNNNSINLNVASGGGAAAGLLVNAAGSTLTDSGASGVNIFTQNFGGSDDGSSASFSNQGSYNKTGNGTSSIAVAFTNSGALSVGAGTLQMSNASTLGGTVAVSPGATLSFVGGAHSVTDAANLNNSGTLRLNSGNLLLGGNMASSGLMAISGGTLDTGPGNHATGSFSQQAGLLTGSGSFTVSGASSLTGGQMRGSGTTVLAGPVTFGNFSQVGLDDGRTLRIAGGATLNNDTINLNSSSTGNAAAGLLVNAAGSTITDGGNSGASISTQNFGPVDNGASSKFTNDGRYLKTGSGNSNISAPMQNNGTVRVEAGQLTLAALLNFSGGTLTGGSFEVVGPGRLNLSGNLVSNAATVLLDGATSSVVNPATGNSALTGFASNLAGGRFTITNGRNLTGAANFSNAGELVVGSGSTFTGAGAALNNQVGGTLQLQGGALAGAALNNAGGLGGFGSVAQAVANSGSITASGGTLALASAVSGTGGSLVAGNGATLALNAAGGSSTGNLLVQGNLQLASDLQVHGDYDNAGFGSGNSFAARAGVSGVGQIVGVGASLALTGNVASTGANAYNMDFGFVRGGTSRSLDFQVANNGSGASVRGALQNAANGALVNDTRLSGSGLVAGNFGPLAAGASSGNFTLTLTPGAGGALSGQQLAVASNFANVSPITLTLNGFATVLAQGAAAPAGPLDLGNFRVGGAPLSTGPTVLNLTNTTSGDGAERLALVSASTNGAFAATSLLGGGFVAPGATAAGAVRLTSSGGVAGVNNGSVVLQFGSNGQLFDASFATQATNAQTVDLLARGYLVAQPSLPAAVDVGAFRVTTGASRAFTLTNTEVAPAGFQEQLNASTGTATPGVTLTGAPVQLASGASSNGFVIGFAAGGTGGVRNGSGTLLLQSDGAGTSGLGVLDLPSASVNVTGTAYNLAVGQAAPSPVPVGNQRVGGVGGGSASVALQVTNAAAPGLFSEALNAVISGSTGDVTHNNGSFVDLAAGALNGGSLVVSVDNSSAGLRSGTVTLSYQSDGSRANGRSGLASVGAGSQTLDVSGSVFRLGAASALPGSVQLANQRVGGSATQALSLNNVAAADGFSERLNATISASGAATAGGAVNLLGAGASSNALFVGLDTSSAGAKLGSATVQLASDGTNTSGFGALGIGSRVVQVSGDVFRLANPQVDATPIALAARVGDGAPSAGIGVVNVSPDGFTERLNASVAAVPAGFVAGAPLVGLAAGGSGTLGLQLNTAAAGSFSGNAVVGLVSSGAGTTGAPDQGLANAAVALSGRVYAPAVAQLNTPAVDFGIVRVGQAVAARQVNVGNAAGGALNDVLVANLSGGGAPFAAAGDATVAAGSDSGAALQVQLSTAAAGIYDGAANLSLTSRNPDLPDLALPGQSVTLRAQVNNLAAPVLAQTGGAGSFSNTAALTYTLDFGTLVQGGASVQALLSLGNLAVGPADALSGQWLLGGLGAGFTANGFSDVQALAAGSNLGGLSVGFSTAALGQFDGVLVLRSASTNGASPDLALGDLTLHLQGNVAAVPEPGTYALMCGGLLAVWLRARRRRAQTNVR